MVLNTTFSRGMTLKSPVVCWSERTGISIQREQVLQKETFMALLVTTIFDSIGFLSGAVFLEFRIVPVLLNGHPFTRGF